MLYFNLLTSGKLYEHLAEIDTSARDMAEYLIKEMAKKQGVTEELKATDMMRWIGLMNNMAMTCLIRLRNLPVFPASQKS